MTDQDFRDNLGFVPAGPHKEALARAIGHMTAQRFGLAERVLLPWAQAKNTDAECALGLLYEMRNDGCGTFGDALYWYLRSARRGHPVAQYSVNVIFFHGWGGCKNRRRALAWLKKAAPQYDLAAAVLAGRLWDKGVRATAYAWQKAACALADNQEFKKGCLADLQKMAASISRKELKTGEDSFLNLRLGEDV